LFYSEDAQTARMERFLKNANELGKLSEIYILPARTKGRDSYRVMYGAYPNIESAQADIPQLPQRYQDVFAPKAILLNSAP
jgi:septal ring-binding cell division protein DamX